MMQGAGIQLLVRGPECHTAGPKVLKLNKKRRQLGRERQTEIKKRDKKITGTEQENHHSTHRVSDVENKGT